MINQLLACNAWKEQMVIHQQLSRRQLPDIIKPSAAVNGLKGSVKSFVLLNLDGDSSFSDLDTLLAIYLRMQEKHESSLQSKTDKACIDKQEEVTGKERIEGRGTTAYLPQPSHIGKGEPDQLPKRKQWCSICWKKGHRTQACWWSNQQQQQHQQQKDWQQPSQHQQWPTQASKKSLRIHEDQHVSKTITPMGSLEHKPLVASFHQTQWSQDATFLLS